MGWAGRHEWVVQGMGDVVFWGFLGGWGGVKGLSPPACAPCVCALPAGCSCDPRGTLASYCATGACDCDRATGTCACRPHVVGRSCDRCAPHFWSLGGAGGCEPCGCHPTRALHPACDAVSPPARTLCPPGLGEQGAEHPIFTTGHGAVPLPPWFWGPRLLPVPGASLGGPRAAVPRWEHGQGTGCGGCGVSGDVGMLGKEGAWG